MKFISPKTDFAFKKIFGGDDSKDILISFLNAILYSGHNTIQDLEIIDPYSPGGVVELKDTYLDVQAVLDDQTKVIIEMQVLNVDSFEKRVVYNLCKTYSNQLKSGQSYARLNPVIALTITDFVLFPHTAKIITHFRFREEEEKFEYENGKLAMFFVELPKFNQELAELETITDKWIYFLKEAPTLAAIPSNMSAVPELEKALQIANQAGLSAEELERLERQELFWLSQRDDLNAATRRAEVEGLQRGLEQGLEQGREEEKKAIARQCLSQGLPMETIIAITQLTVEQIENL